MFQHSVTVTEDECGDVQTVCRCMWAGPVRRYTTEASYDTNLALGHEDGNSHLHDIEWERRNNI